MKRLDNLLFKIYGVYPSLSPGRYESFYHLAKIIKRLSLNNSRILEIGCGSGAYAIFLDNFFSHITFTGIDIDLKAKIKEIKKKIKRIKVQLRLMDGSKLNFPKESFDLVLSLFSLEHIKKDSQVLREAFRVLKEKGKVLILVPTIFTFLFQFGHHGFHYYSKREITFKLENVGFRVEKLIPVGGLAGFLFSLWQNWLDLLILLPCGIFLKVFYPNKLAGDSRKDIGGGIAKKILSWTSHLCRRFIIGKKIHFCLLKILKRVDFSIPIFPTAYLIVVKK